MHLTYAAEKLSPRSPNPFVSRYLYAISCLYDILQPLYLVQGGISRVIAGKPDSLCNKTEKKVTGSPVKIKVAEDFVLFSLLGPTDLQSNS